MQGEFLKDEDLIKELRKTLSEPRLSKYMVECKGDIIKALALYHWNCRLSQCLYLPLQMWEVALRNKLNRFLLWKFGGNWPYDDKRCKRTLTGKDRKKLEEAIEKERRDRGVSTVTVDAIVAGLSAGFWVSLLSTSYNVPFAWRYNLARVFAHDARMSRADAHEACERLLEIRNRIAHHEPIYHRDLPARCNDIKRMLGGLCRGSAAYIEANGDFEAVFKTRPI